MLLYFSWLLFFSIATNSFSSEAIDTFNITLISRDTSFYLYVHHSGNVYDYQDKKDSIYLKLDYVVSGCDMGYCGIRPSYRFKSTAPDGVYNIYVVSQEGYNISKEKSLLHQI